ncbi:MCE family protein [Amycolatopsis suaedae]|uniref:MCE family protein n=1 Tax=Amycolatopsis suaedae TaxID=2510978 RepID=A0A4Q7JEP8_9PSEU|nr:MCE family protein [Amycolatopsis suaedae]RZQ64924.1 MCE family protein [Amycolatopsis suaedae]
MSKVFVVITVAAVVVAGALWWIFSGDGDKRVTAQFGRAVGVYAGSDVRLLGVRIGEVEEVTPVGDRVDVRLRVDGTAPVAANTRALVVAPSVVSDRYVQFSTLARRGTERIADGALIGVERTATPVELDELYASLNTLTHALGPQGANANGALSELLRTGAANLAGNGRAINDNIGNFAQLARTLADSKEDLFGTVDQLRTFTNMLATNDGQVRAVNTKLAEVAQLLAADREELSGALAALGASLGEVQAFIRDNRVALKSTVDRLAHVTQNLVDNRAELAEALDSMPLAVENVGGAFDARSGTLQGRPNMEYFIPGGPPLPLPVSGR